MSLHRLLTLCVLWGITLVLALAAVGALLEFV